jgi:hypothetical protein
MSLGQFLDLAGGVLWLDPNTIQAIAQSPDGLRFALAVLLLGSLSDAVGNSPILFLRGVGGRRFALCLLVDTVLSLLRIAAWIVSLAVLVNLLSQVDVSPAEVTLIVGIGFVPMLLSFLALLPLLGPALLRLLHAWVLLATIAALRAILALSFGQALVFAVLGWAAVLVIGRTVDRVVVRGFGRLTQRLLGVDLLLRFDQVDLVGEVMVGGPLRDPATSGAVGKAEVTS